MISKINVFFNVIAIEFALMEIIAVILGAIPSAFCYGVAWFCVICWVVNAWINQYRLEKKDDELAKCENMLEYAMKKIDSFRAN